MRQGIEASRDSNSSFTRGTRLLSSPDAGLPLEVLGESSDAVSTRAVSLETGYVKGLSRDGCWRYADYHLCTVHNDLLLLVYAYIYIHIDR